MHYLPSILSTPVSAEGAGHASCRGRAGLQNMLSPLGGVLGSDLLFHDKGRWNWKCHSVLCMFTFGALRLQSSRFLENAAGDGECTPALPRWESRGGWVVFGLFWALGELLETGALHCSTRCSTSVYCG